MQSLPAVPSSPMPSYMRPTASRSIKSRRDSLKRDRSDRFGRSKIPEMSPLVGTSSSIPAGRSSSVPSQMQETGRVPRHLRALADAAALQDVEATSSMPSSGSSMLQQESLQPFVQKHRPHFILSEASKLHEARPSYFVRSSFSQTCEANGVALPTHWHVKQSPVVLQEGIDDIKKGVHLVNLAKDAIGRLESKRKSAESEQFVCALPEQDLLRSRERFFEVLYVLFDSPACGIDPCI